MSFISYEFLLFFLPLSALLAALFRKRRLQNAVLAAASVFFYASFGAAGVFFLAYSALVTYAAGQVGYRLTQQGRREGRGAYIAGIALNFAPLLLFKYGDFAAENANRLLGRIGMAIPLPHLLLPVGLSFFVFQSATYLFELYRGNLEPERNPVDYLLFVSFFPTIASGPIQRANVLLPQIRERKGASLERVQRAAVLFVWGAFLKMVLADRLVPFTDTVFSMYMNYEGVVLLAGACAYSVQIYADFLGYTCMALAVASLFGFELPQNFRQPYLATSMADFWHRWHISLTSWLTDYIYIPLGGSRRGMLRRYANILIVFLVSGLWHGAAWHFVAWGALHALFQIAGHATLRGRQSLCRRLGIDRSTRAYRCWQRAFTFALVTAGWVFFRMGSTKAALVFLRRMVFGWNPWALTDGTLFTLGIDPANWNICILATATLIGVSLCREKELRTPVKTSMPARLLVFVFLLCTVVIFGCYGGAYDANAFIYTGF